VLEKFGRKFTGNTVLRTRDIINLLRKLSLLGLFMDNKRGRRRSVLAGGKVDEIGTRLEPTKSLRRLS
jgi:hypothetical protein